MERKTISKEFITVEAVQNGEAIVSLKNKTRTVFIVRELQEKLIKYANKIGITSGMIFVTRTAGKPIAAQTFGEK